jgi:hypothetical protein
VVRTAIGLLAAASLAGCSALSFHGGVSTSISSSATTGASALAAKLAQARRTHEFPGPPERQTASSAAVSPVVAIQAFATAYINWTAATVSATMRTLAAASIGQARSEMALAAGQTAQDYELRQGGIANEGMVEAIAPLVGHRDEYVVVTRERTTAANTSAYEGLRPAWHLTLATVTDLTPGRWVLSDWQPEN